MILTKRSSARVGAALAGRFGGRSVASQIVLVMGLLSACKTESDGRTVVKIVPQDQTSRDLEATISEAEYRRELARMRLERDSSLNAAPIERDLRQAILDRMIDRRLLMLEAAHKGIRASTAAVDRELSAIRASLPDFEKQLVQTYQTETDLKGAIEERLIVAQLLKQEAFARVKVSEDEARHQWESLPAEEKQRPARVHAAQIVLRTEEEGKAAVHALRKGADFAELARKDSISPEAVRGGDLGWFERGVMPAVFDEVCFALEPGQVSELTASEYGFHIFKVLESEPERALTYEDARPELIERLREERIRSAELAYLEGLRSRVKIVKNDVIIGQVE